MILHDIYYDIDSCSLTCTLEWYAHKIYFKTYFYSSCGDKTIIVVISKVSIMVEKIFVKRPNIQFPRLAHEGIHHPLFALSSSPFHFICQMLSKY